MDRLMWIPSLTKIAGVSYEQPAIFRRHQAAENADPPCAGWQLLSRCPATGRKVSYILSPISTEPAASIDGSAIYFAKAEPQTAIRIGSQTCHRRDLWFNLAQRPFDPRASQHLFITILQRRDFHHAPASQRRAALLAGEVQPMALIFAPVETALFPCHPNSAIGGTSDARMSFVVLAGGDGVQLASFSICDARQKDVIVSIAITVECDPRDS